MAKMKIAVEYLVDLMELEMSRATYHDGSDLSLHSIFADDLQSHAHDGEGCLYGEFTVVSVSEVV